MPTYEHKRTGRLMTVSGAAAEAGYEANPEWRLLPEQKPLTPKQKLQADAEALGLSVEGTADEITARIDEHAVELRKQAAELGIDDDKLTAVELSKAIEAKLAE
jgi:hypothetical protein